MFALDSHISVGFRISKNEGSRLSPTHSRRNIQFSRFMSWIRPGPSRRLYPSPASWGRLSSSVLAVTSRHPRPGSGGKSGRSCLRSLDNDLRKFELLGGIRVFLQDLEPLAGPAKELAVLRLPILPW